MGYEMTEFEKNTLRNKLMKNRESGHRFWEIWCCRIPDYGPVPDAKLMLIAEGTYEEVVDYALSQSWFWGRNHYTPELIHDGHIKPFETPIKRVWEDAVREDKIKELERKKKELGREIAKLKKEM